MPKRRAKRDAVVPRPSLPRSPECDFTTVIVARAVVTDEPLIDRASAFDLFLSTYTPRGSALSASSSSSS